MKLYTSLSSIFDSYITSSIRYNYTILYILILIIKFFLLLFVYFIIYYFFVFLFFITSQFFILILLGCLSGERPNSHSLYPCILGLKKTKTECDSDSLSFQSVIKIMKEIWNSIKTMHITKMIITLKAGFSLILFLVHAPNHKMALIHHEPVSLPDQQGGRCFMFTTTTLL